LPIQKSKKLSELIQAVKILSKNPELLVKNPALFAEILESGISSDEISLASFESSRKEENYVSKQMEGRVHEICEKIKMEVLEEVRSEISGLFEALKEQSSVETMMQAISDSMKMISQIQEVKRIYVFLEPANLQFIIVHDANDRLSLLRKIMEIGNMLDAKFEDIYFEFKVLHHSEINENLISEGRLIFMRA
jgi:hypothetical protein